MPASSFEEYEHELRKWVDHRKVVDALLERPSETLLRELNRTLASTEPHDPERWRVVATIDKRGRGEPAPLLVHAICCSTAQRLWAQRRRFDWIKDEKLEPMSASILTGWQKLEETTKKDVFALIDALPDKDFGPGNELISAEIFWVLMKAGEKHAHGPLGFYALFTMLWALRWSAMVSEAGGSGLETSRPRAVVAAKCLLPLRRLTMILRRRASLYKKIAATLRKLQDNASNATQRERWLFVIALESLVSHLHEFASVTVNPAMVQATAMKIAEEAAPIRPAHTRERLQQVADRVRKGVAELLVSAATAAEPVLKDASSLLTDITSKIVAGLAETSDEKTRDTLLEHMPQLEGTRNDAANRRRHHDAASDAAITCVSACETLLKGIEEPKKFAREKLIDSQSLIAVLETLSTHNTNVAELLDKHVGESTQWLRRRITQPGGLTAGGDQTSAVELLSAVAVVQRWHRVSDLEVEAALEVVKACCPDRAWNSAQPVVIPNRLYDIFPSTPDVMWLMAIAVEQKRKIRVIDDTLIGFIGWLDKTRIELAWATPGAIAEYEEESGWPAEGRDRDTIDLWSTALAINALLSIRELIEQRLWALCERRFTVQKTSASLERVDPVDLGARHDKRLHHRMIHMARQTAGADYARAEYSLVMHGPPGSSKTALSEALAGAMWSDRGESRLVRITPADFTRQGEQRVDSEARFIFELLSNIRGATILFDEIDQLLQRRSPHDQLSFLKLVVPGMLNRLQDLRDAAPRQEICFVFATNFVDMIDPALTRPGRIDVTVPVPYPDPWSRENVMERVFGIARPLSRRQRADVIRKTNGWPWSTFQKLCKEIRDEPPPHGRALDMPIARRGEDFEPSESYYGNSARWELDSRPFARELVHATFAFSKERKGCLNKLREILGEIRPKADITAVFDAEVGNRLAIATDTGLPRKPIDGESAMTSGVTVHTDGSVDFRVWAPFAQHVSVAGTFNDWGKERTDSLARDEERRFFWKGTIANVMPPGPKVSKRPKLPAPPSAKLAAVTTVPEALLPPQYRYVITAKTDEQLWRSDPFSTELIDVHAYLGVHNSVITPKSETLVPKPRIDSERVVIYQLHPATFTPERTLRAAIEKLDALKDLGITAVEILMREPRYDEPWGYDAEFPLALRTASGGAAALRDFIDEAHRRGIGVIAGIRWNNIGREVDAPGDDDGEGKKRIVDGGLWRFDGWPSDEDDGGIYYNAHSFDFHLQQREVRDYLFVCAQRWITDLKVDGLRWNDADLFVKTHDTLGSNLIKDVVAAMPPSVITIAQEDEETPGTLAGLGFQAVWNRSFMTQLHSLFHQNENEPFDLKALATAINGDADAHTRVLYSDSYREAEFGRFPRVESLDFTRRKRAMLAATLVFTACGIPMIFQGQEDLLEGTFGPDAILAAEEDFGMRLLYRDLIRLRTSVAALRGRTTASEVDQELLTIHRTDGTDSALVILNLSRNYVNRSIWAPAEGNWTVSFNTAAKWYGMEGTDGGSSGSLAASDGQLPFEIDPWSAMILTRAQSRRSPS